jgi:hypothetical protein
MKRNYLFYCYSPNLKNFLTEHGIKFLHKGLNESTQRTFWVYERNVNLNNSLTKWSQYNEVTTT